MQLSCKVIKKNGNPPFINQLLPPFQGFPPFLAKFDAMMHFHFLILIHKSLKHFLDEAFKILQHYLYSSNLHSCSFFLQTILIILKLFSK